jgi:hypothetical protein
MRAIGQISTIFVVAGVLLTAQTPAGPAAPAAGAPTQASIDSAAKVLADARTALGGDAKLSAIKSIVATGRTRRVAGDNLVPVEFEISMELPDKYVRKDEVPAQETAPSSSGFNGEALIQIPPPAAPPTAPPGAAAAGAGRAAGAPAAAPAAGATPPAGAPPAGAAPARPAPGAPGAAGPGAGPGGGPAAGRGPAMSPTQQRVLALKQDFVRLTLGMFATSFSSYPLTFSFFGFAEAPQGKADVIDIKGPGNFTGRLFIDDATHLPIMVSWQTNPTPANIVLLPAGQPKPATLAPGAIIVNVPAAPAATAPQEEKDKYTRDVAAARTKAMTENKIENRIYYADYREADGVKFPYRLRRAVNADTIEETTFDRFRLNSKIDPKKFDPVK